MASLPSAWRRAWPQVQKSVRKGFDGGSAITDRLQVGFLIILVEYSRSVDAKVCIDEVPADGSTPIREPGFTHRCC